LEDFDYTANPTVSAEVIGTLAVDRLTFNGHITETGSRSYRLASTRASRRPR
jgi:hypothetical protein